MIDRNRQHPDAGLTLREAFERHYEKDHLTAGTLGQFEVTFRLWERLTDNPPVGDITGATLEGFKRSLIEQGRAPRTFNSKWTNIRAILRRLAEPYDGNPHGLGVIGRVPYVRACRVPWRTPRRVSLEDLGRCYVAAKFMRNPRRLGYDPPLMWRALLVVAYFTGLRKSDLFSIRLEDIDLERRTLAFIARKTGKADVFPLHPIACQHVAQILGPREFLFPPWIGTGSHLQGCFRAIQDAGQVSERFTLHDIRRTGSSEVERVRPGMGRVFLQHAPRTVTDVSYLNMMEELAEAIAAMRAPLEFKHGVELTERAEARNGKAKQALHVNQFALPYVPVPGEWIFPLAAVGCAAGAVCFRGEWYSVAGETRWKVLKALALAEEPIGVAELAPIVCRHSIKHVEKRVQAEVSNLRKTLRAMFGMSDKWDPVRCVNRGDCDGGRWQIWFPPNMAPGKEAARP